MSKRKNQKEPIEKIENDDTENEKIFLIDTEIEENNNNLKKIVSKIQAEADEYKKEIETLTQEIEIAQEEKENEKEEKNKEIEKEIIQTIDNLTAKPKQQSNQVINSQKPEMILASNDLLKENQKMKSKGL